jgi:PAS domain S-box-containing protein
MRLLKKLSIRSKLIAILLFLSIISLAIGFIFVISHDIATFRKELVENGTTIARVIGDYSVVDLTFQDPQAAKQTLAKLNSIDQVACAFLYDANGNLFSTYSSKGSCGSPVPRAERVQFEGEFLHLSQPIQDKDRKYGTIYLRFSLAGLNRKINSYLFTMLTLAVALIILSFVLALQLQRLISKPLIELAEATKRVTDERDYSIRVASDSSDEVGVLFSGFNRMLSQLEKRKMERDEAEHALRESEYRYRVLVESSPEAIFLEQDGKIVYVNPAGLNLAGYASLSELDKVKINSFIQTHNDTADRDDALPREALFSKKSGTLIDVEILSVKTTHRGKPATQYLIRDITESKNLRQAAQRMERLAAIGEFSAMLAHEIRNSIGSVALNVRLLSERMQVPENYRKNLQNMELGIHRTQEIIKALLDFARPATPKLQTVGLHKVIESSIHLVEDELTAAGITVERNYDPSGPQVSIDVPQISQVLMNLFLNAKDAMDHEGKIIVTTAQRSSGVIIDVADTGKGIPRENLSKIFDPFFTTTPKGVGLGLAFVSRILEQHHAQIFVDSKQGSGTVFTIHFPDAGR